MLRTDGSETPRGVTKFALRMKEVKPPVLKLRWTSKKAFENVNRQQLVEIAAKVGYPMPELLTSIMAYFWPRHIVYEGVASRGIVPRSGIAAGSASATFELTALLLPALKRMAI